MLNCIQDIFQFEYTVWHVMYLNSLHKQIIIVFNENICSKIECKTANRNVLSENATTKIRPIK